MSCFWQGILSSLTKKDRSFFKLKTKSISPENIQTFILRLKLLNTQTQGLMWNQEHLSDQQILENYQHIKDYDCQTVNDGYDCSCAEPFLFLIAYLLQVNIFHDYNGHLIKYTIDDKKYFRTLHFSSDTEHFMKG